MKQKIFEELRAKFEGMTTEELKILWKENDQDTYTLNELETVRQLLHVRNAEVPKQKEFEESEDGVYSQDVVNSLLKGAMIFLLIFGAVNLVYWFFGGLAERMALLDKFKDVRPLLWVTIYGEVVVSFMLIFMGGLCFLQRDNIKILLFSGTLLILSGLWNLFSGFLSIPALAEYNVSRTIDNVLGDGKYFLYVIGVLQVRWGYNQIKDYFKVKKFDNANNPKSEYGNTPT